jgi:hypothetical protein
MYVQMMYSWSYFRPFHVGNWKHLMTTKFKSMYFLVARYIRPFDANKMKRKIRRLSYVPKASKNTSFCCTLQELNSSFEAEVSASYIPGGDGGHNIRKLNLVFVRLDRADTQPSGKNLFPHQTVLIRLCHGTTVVPLEARTAVQPN